METWTKTCGPLVFSFDPHPSVVVACGFLAMFREKPPCGHLRINPDHGGLDTSAGSPSGGFVKLKGLPLKSIVLVHVRS